MSSSKKNKSSGLRMLWIPGRKSHSKGHYSSTNKHVSYSPSQKKSEVWTLGGSRTQNELIDLPSPEDNNGASTSSLALLGGTMSSTLVKSVKSSDSHENLHNHLNHNHSENPNPNQNQNRENHNIIISSTDPLGISECVTLPTTPVAAITPNLNSPLSELAPSTPSTNPMTSPIVVTTVEILDFHNILSPDDLPKVPSIGETTDLNTSAVVLNSSAGTTASIATNSSPLANRKLGGNNQGQGQTTNNNSSSQNASPQKGRYRNHNNNQDDINSIESVSSSFNRNRPKMDFDWIDEMVQQSNCNELAHKNKRKKSKKHLDSKTTSSDHVDACKVVNKDQFMDSAGFDAKSKKAYDDNDEKVVKCLYYSLMCCDCTIS